MYLRRRTIDLHQIFSGRGTYDAVLAQWKLTSKTVITSSSIVMGSEDVMTKPANIADLERLEDDIEAALISLIDKPADALMIADLRRRKLHLRDAIELLRHQAVESGRSN